MSSLRALLAIQEWKLQERQRWKDLANQGARETDRLRCVLGPSWAQGAVSKKVACSILIPQAASRRPFFTLIKSILLKVTALLQSSTKGASGANGADGADAEPEAGAEIQR